MDTQLAETAQRPGCSCKPGRGCPPSPGTSSETRTKPRTSPRRRGRGVRTPTARPSPIRRHCSGRPPSGWPSTSSSPLGSAGSPVTAPRSRSGWTTTRALAAYVLREGFGCPYDRIAEILHLSVVNRRQQVARAQRRLNGNHRRQQADSVAHRRLVQAFFSAARTGDLGHLERLMRAVGGDRCGRCQRAWPGGRNLVDADVPGPGDGLPDIVGDFPFGLCPSRRVQARRGRRVPCAVASCRNAAE
ncbi:hypothetical protein QFZ22_009760 [Streptomyces canus]|uniref:RNA polymerase sigma-70 region 4 domain-containing protein n=1 Tax=Streptomyces canus TaxID=58343 RepID=A0AAW8FYD1_9ACTN|nr:hypothetical protein [Streptomyces canus]